MNFLKEIVNFFYAPFKPNTSLTVRYAFPIAFSIAALLSAAAVVSNTNESYIHLETSAKSLRAGEQFEIDVYVNAHVAINAVDIALRFPKEQIEIIGIDTGESVITLWTEEPYVENDTVVLRGGTFRRGFRGNHLIATINAKATESGLAEFTTSEVTLLAGDGTGSEVKVSETGEEEAKLYVANEDGTYAEGAEPDEGEGVGLQGEVSIVIVTDIDGDGQVTLGDISRFMTAWFSKGIIYDFNSDGMMTFRDFGIILAHSFTR